MENYLLNITIGKENQNQIELFRIIEISSTKFNVTTL